MPRADIRPVELPPGVTFEQATPAHGQWVLLYFAPATIPDDGYRRRAVDLPALWQAVRWPVDYPRKPSLWWPVPIVP